ncbi:transposase and inactivated derivatives [Serpentinimonas maccroryi]|uniref:Transposase and inactivated derivatives n=1 Tax=Serpentinimonas maccroryi TaxID=1458426 RepID=A0A060NVF7_9BURK|nr:transposase and inactivated derivatives [Serpentinimonas maccroryi]
MSQARECIVRWRQDYNEVRPHSSPGRIPPARFVQQHRQPLAVLLTNLKDKKSINLPPPGLLRNNGTVNGGRSGWVVTFKSPYAGIAGSMPDRWRTVIARKTGCLDWVARVLVAAG